METLTPVAPVATPPSKGMAVAALVCGIVGAFFGLIPLTAFFAMPLGLVAFILGLIAARKIKRAGHKAGMARAGWLLGAVAVVLAIIGFAIMNSAVNKLQSDLDNIGTEQVGNP
jgi:ABC-type transport system involved in cytochrome bd biosynthesis fused ATPase/permease subunit